MRRRYHTLDSLRGVAALVVVAGHSVDWLRPLPVPRAYLAVDLFFLLSGFVLSKVYEPRFAIGMTGWQFLAQRYIRLWPLFAVGALIGIISEAFALIAHHSKYSLDIFFKCAASGLLMLPSIFTINQINDLYPFNHPGWSLAFELLANIIYFYIWRRLQGLRLPILVLCLAILLFTMRLWGLGFDGPTWPTFSGGVLRVCFSFFAGVLISRHSNGTFTVSNRAWLAPLALVTVLYCIPFRSTGNDDAGWLLDTFLLFCGFPILVILSAKVEPVRSKIFIWLGLISYPIYAIHEPIVYIAWRALGQLHLQPRAIAPWGGLALGLAIAAACPLLVKLYDEPAQAMLKKKFAYLYKAVRSDVAP